MQVIYALCCGLDVTQTNDHRLCAEVVGRCLAERDSTVWYHDQGSAWLVGEGCTHVAMESTGVYWKPLYNILEGQLELLVVNAQHLKSVPGRKTDVRDAEWIAELLAHGLLHGSFVPPPNVRELRELTRYRTSLVRDRARTINRLQKVLEAANIKLASVVSDIDGVRRG
jgi:transposase